MKLNLLFRNCIDATSLCFDCICEVLDYWWAKDAPNCYKKEIVKLMEKDTNNTQQSEAAETQENGQNITLENIIADQKEEL